jgi:hypothetical protein
LHELLHYVATHFPGEFLRFKERLAVIRLEDINFTLFAKVDALRQRAEFARELVLHRRTLIWEWKAP